MAISRFLDRSGREQISANQGQDVLEFNSSGVGEGGGAQDAFDASLLLAQFPEVVELGRPGVDTVISADASAEAELDVPAGKFRRLVGASLHYLASADAATRTPIITIEQEDDTALDTITISTKTANQRETDLILFGTDGRVEGNAGVAAQGTLTIAEQVTAEDDMTIDGVVYTFVTADDGTVSNAIVVGGTEAETKTNIEAKLVTGDQHPTVTFAEFDGDDMVITARNPGVAGDALATTETFTHGSNVFDATTLGGTTAGVDPAHDLGGDDFPAAGVLLQPTDKVVINVTNGHANDAFELSVFYIEFDNDPAA